jgi:hypothetical protein
MSMRVLVTGQIGLDKKQYLEEVVRLAEAAGEIGGDGRGMRVYHIGDMMYREAPDVPAGRILDLPLSRLNSLRRAVFRDVLADLSGEGAPKHAIVNTHATFRWKHGLFAAFDFDQLALFNADLYVVLVDNIETVHARLLRDHDFEHSLKDLMVWREEEILATEILAKAPLPHAAGGAGAHAGGGHAGGARFLVLARGRAGMEGNGSTAETLFRLIFRPHMKKVYPSFPMSHVADLPETLAEINAFRAKINEHFIAFDPGDVDEKLLADAAIRAAQAGKGALVIPHPAPEGGSQRGGGTLTLKLADLLAILPDIDGQIYARDFMLVRQADMIISYIPELPGGKPGLSSGVERELQHSHDHGRDVYVIWKPRKDPSPFVTQTANRVFRSIEEAMAFFEGKGYLQKHSLFG